MFGRTVTLSGVSVGGKRLLEFCVGVEGLWWSGRLVLVNERGSGGCDTGWDWVVGGCGGVSVRAAGVRVRLKRGKVFAVCALNSAQMRLVVGDWRGLCCGFASVCCWGRGWVVRFASDLCCFSAGCRCLWCLVCLR